MKKATPNQPIQKEPKTPQQVWPQAESLKPGLAMMQAAAEGHLAACAIRNCWRTQHPVKRMSAEAYAALIERCGSVTF